MTAFLPPPDPKRSGDSRQGAFSHDAQDRPKQDTHGQRHTGAGIPSVEELLAMLLKVNGLVLTGLISATTANVIHRNLRAVLDAQLKREQGQAQGIAQEGLADLCRKDPSVLKLLEPFLTDAQIDWLMERVTDAEDE